MSVLKIERLKELALSLKQSHIIHFVMVAVCKLIFKYYNFLFLVESQLVDKKIKLSTTKPPYYYAILLIIRNISIFN